MKKIVLTVAIVLGMAVGASAQYNDNAPQGGGLFKKGATNEEPGRTNTGTPMLPGLNQSGNQDANQGPIGSGALLLIGFGAAYALSKKRKD